MRIRGSRLASVLFVLALMTQIVSCSQQPQDAEAERATQNEIPAGSLTTESVHFQYAIYYLPSSNSDPLIVLRQLLAETKDAPALVNDIPEMPNQPVVSAYSLEDVRDRYPPPNLRSLQHDGKGLTPEQAELLQTSRQVVILDFAHGGTQVGRGLQLANILAEDLARRTGGLMWDEETRQIFTPDEWRKKRMQSWSDGIPDVSKHTTIHAYKSGDYVRAITLGMAKFGLPDVVVENFGWSLNRPMGNLINLFCQSLVEGAIIERPGQFDLDIRRIRHQAVRDPQNNSLKPNATAFAQLGLSEATPEDGDPRNRLIAIGFGRYPGSDVHSRQEALLDSLFGWEDEVTPVDRNNAELRAASRDAKAQLPKLRKAFVDGLAPGEFIQVKAPFRIPEGGNEWMWVEITGWNGDNIKGLLKNEPSSIPSLHNGQIVEVKQQDVFDFIRQFPDGHQEGNETGAIIQKLQAK